MKDFFKNKTTTVLITIATLVLAGIAIFTATRLYQLRQQSVSPATPESRPGAQVTDNSTESCNVLSFTISSPSPTPTATPVPGCYETCSSDADCPGSMECQNVTGGFKCVNPTCSSDTDCSCDKTSPTPTATPTPTPGGTGTPAPSLPEAGVATPTLVGIGLGAMVLIFSLLLAL